LSSLDATFLELEEADDSANMHIGAVMTFDSLPGGGTPSIEELREHLDNRLDALPRYRQRLSEQHTGGLRWPEWVDDERFDLETHVRHATLPWPGGACELHDWAADFWSHRLDRSRPLWDIVLLDGLADGRWALATRTHHCMVDGVGSVDVAHLLLDDQPRAASATDLLPAVGGTPEHLVHAPDWLAAPVHAAEIAARAVRDGALVVLHPVDTLHASKAVVELILREELAPAPHSSLNSPISATRRFVSLTVPLDDIRTVKDAAGCTINDVALAAVSGGLRALLLARDERPPRGLRAMVPVNRRELSEHGDLGNKISSLFVELPVDEPDAEARLHRVRATTTALKAGGQALGASTLLSLTSLAPPVLHSALARALYATRLFNVTVTNVPGPQVPLYAFGARMRNVLPLVPLAADHAVGISMVSYDGRLTFGLIADRNQVPDIQLLADGIEGSLVEMTALATVAV
jgi:WS/DGAT/MGAT family acyltransferase